MLGTSSYRRHLFCNSPRDNTYPTGVLALLLSRRMYRRHAMPKVVIYQSAKAERAAVVQRKSDARARLVMLERNVSHVAKAHANRHILCSGFVHFDGGRVKVVRLPVLVIFVPVEACRTDVHIKVIADSVHETCEEWRVARPTTLVVRN